MKTNKLILVSGVILLLFASCRFSDSKKELPKSPVASSSADCWTGAGIYQIPVDGKGLEIRYGRELIANTAFYLGPKGTVARISNGMNCQNCHLEAGTKPWGNNYGAVASTYPKYRERSGHIESIEKRVNDCLERSLNGQALDSSSKEMRAMVAYIKWLGNEIPKGVKPRGSGIMQPAFLQRAADPEKGKTVYTANCERCHGRNGEGQMNIDNATYQYPPLWGAHSYNNGAGLFRLSRLAGYVKSNMPNPTNYHTPLLTDEEAWDVAAFINSQPRPSKDLSQDWPDIRKKPFDHPFGPYADGKTEAQHKFGPY
ncbi:MAG: c-type cytochrome [Bacteroidota bacterium]